MMIVHSIVLRAHNFLPEIPSAEGYGFRTENINFIYID